MTRSILLSGAIALGLCSTTFLAHAASPTCPAKLFAPGQITTPDRFESRMTFTPSRNTIYWTVTDNPGPPGSDAPYTIMTAYRTPNGWSMPTVASFSGIHSDSDPFVTPLGNSLIFSSNRPGSTAPYPLNDLWISHRTPNGWSAPVNMGPNVNSAGNELYASTDLWGNVYFASDRDGEQFDLYRSRRRLDGRYAPAEKLGPGVNDSYLWEFNPEISPDGRTLVYATYGREDSYGDVDMYVSRRGADGEFGGPVNLGPCVNSEAPEFNPTVLWERGEIYFARVNETLDLMVAPLKLPR